MNKAEFINWLISNYDNNEDNISYTIKIYSNGLIDTWDFNRIKSYLEEKSNFGTLPEIYEIGKIARENNFIFSDCEEKCEALRHIQAIKKEPHVPMHNFDEELKNKIRIFCSKYGIKPIFDK